MYYLKIAKSAPDIQGVPLLEEISQRNMEQRDAFIHLIIYKNYTATITDTWKNIYNALDISNSKPLARERLTCYLM